MNLCAYFLHLLDLDKLGIRQAYSDIELLGI